MVGITLRWQDFNCQMEALLNNDMKSYYGDRGSIPKQVVLTKWYSKTYDFYNILMENKLGFSNLLKQLRKGGKYGFLLIV